MRSLCSQYLKKADQNVSYSVHRLGRLGRRKEEHWLSVFNHSSTVIYSSFLKQIYLYICWIHLRCRLPDLPYDFLSASRDSISAPSESTDRIRNVPHIPGNWATSVYIPVKHQGLDVWIDQAFERLRSKNPDLERILPQDSELDGLHISLSRTVYLKVYQIDSFQDILRKRISEKHAFVAAPSKVATYSNDEQTRSFVSVDLYGGTHHLLELVEIVNEAMTQFNQPSFYEVCEGVA